MKNYFASRTDWPLASNPLTKALQKRHDEGLPILDLTESNPTRCGFDYPVQEISKALTQSESFIYEPHPKGHLQARKAIAAYYEETGIHLNPEHIFLTASTSEAYSFIFRLIANPGDTVLVPQPGYPLFDFLCTLNDIELIPYPLIYEKNWHINFETLSKYIQPSTKAILLVNPNNPTGSYIKPKEKSALVSLAKEHQLSLISDEVFFDYPLEHESKKFYSFSGTSEVMTFTLNGLSKMTALPQMKLAWIAVTGPKEMLQKAVSRLEIIMDTFLSVNTPTQVALSKILKNRKFIQNQILKRLKENHKFLRNLIKNFPACEYLESEGGWYAILKIPRTKTDEEWALDLLEQKGVSVHPGHFYNFNDEGHLVISLLPFSEIFAEGMNKILAHIAQ
jgi:aspartate/methionine/tyrosine aminotransferase